MSPSYHSEHWFKAYCDAMLHSKEEDLLAVVDGALEAIQQRVFELRPDHCQDYNEIKQLQEALYYLTLLVENAGRDGRFLWC